MFETVDFVAYEPHIDFAYTTLLMIWGGSLVGIGMLAVPFIFKHIKSRDEASTLTSLIFRRQDMLIRGVAITMLFVFYFKSKLAYSYQYYEWVVYVGVLHFFIFGKIASKRLWKIRADVGSFDNRAEAAGEAMRKFQNLHKVARYLYMAQFIGVVILLYLHAFGL